MNLEIAEEFLPLFDPQNEHYHKRWLCWWGGRGSGKTVSISKGLLVRGFRKKERILCCRQFQNSLSDSVLKTLEDEVYELGLQGFYEVQNNAIYGKNGTEFLFKGLHNNVQSIKSTAGVTLTFIEEAQTVSEKSYEILIPTVLRTENPQIIVAFNPDQENDPTYRRMITNPPSPDEAYICRVNYDANPWMPPALRAEMEYLRRVDPDAYAHVWMGECRVSSAAQVLHGKWRIEEFETPTGGTELAGLDFGYVDPTAAVKCWVVGNGPNTNGKLYIEHELYRVGLDTVDTGPALRAAIPGIERLTIRSDSARPETISHLRMLDKLKAVSVEKWKGSVEDGIAFLRSFEEIVIHPRCRNAIQEARLWSYKINKLTGDVTPDLADGNEHIWDAVRYALGPLIKRSGPGAGFLQFIADQKADTPSEKAAT